MLFFFRSGIPLQITNSWALFSGFTGEDEERTGRIESKARTMPPREHFAKIAHRDDGEYGLLRHKRKRAPVRMPVAAISAVRRDYFLVSTLGTAVVAAVDFDLPA